MQVAETKASTQFVQSGRKCTVCEHESVTAINTLLASGALSNRRIAAQFKLGNRAVDNHAISHIPKVLARAAERREIKAEDIFAERCEQLWNHASEGIAAAKEAVRTVADEEGKLHAVGRDLSPLAPLLGQAHANLRLYAERHQLITQAAAAAGINVNLQIVIPRQVEAAELPAIDVRALPELPEKE